MQRIRLVLAALCGVVATGLLAAAPAQPAGERLKLDPAMVTNEAEHGEPQGLVDEQDVTGASAPPAGAPERAWEIPSQHSKTIFPASAYLDLGDVRPLSTIWFYDTNGDGDVVISAGKPGEWTQIATYDCKAYKAWQAVSLDVETRYLRLTRKTPGSNFNEIALYAHAPQDWAALQQRKADEAKAAAEREAALAQAREEQKNRPTIDLGEPLGTVTLVDEVIVSAEGPGHDFAESPAGASRVQDILGKPARVLSKTPGEGAYMTFRLGRYKLLKPGATYVLEVEYPEDVPRSMVVLNAGNETARGFHTGAALGDAYRPKYVNNNNESIAVPLAGEYRTWTMLFNLHDRFPKLGYIRGEGTRELTSDDGFPVTIAQFSAENLPISHGAAVSRIRLLEIKEPARVNVQLRLPPAELPRRHLFWREEMADGVVQSKDETKRGLKDPLDWYRFKANQMQFLGMHTYAKDLLEFGSVQHWDPTPYGGNAWAFFDANSKDRWAGIVKIMGERGFDVLPYYEYAGSKGQQGLGSQRRAKPLTRDDAFTHIKWIESANADITDPDTYDDFKKMLDVTVIQHNDVANFVGAWLRPRMQLPMGFGDATRKRFADEANGGVEVSRQQLIDDAALLEKYEAWWHGKRREFLVAMRDHLRSNGVDDATILYTPVSGEPGVSFKRPGGWLVTDDVEGWRQRLATSGDERDGKITPVSVDDVVREKMYAEALTSPPGTWGGWELHHASPRADPENYNDTDGVLMTHAFNRLYTVASPETFDAFRGPAGLAVLRHYSLNENMMFDQADKPKLGYFVADIERAGPYCMMGEAMAVADGDPRFIGYLVGLNFGRGFPKYVRDFNRAFLALPALPSDRLADASSDADVVVRSIKTERHGTYLAVVNRAMTDKSAVEVRLPAGTVTDAATGEPMALDGGAVRLTLYPYQLRALHVQP
jgi:hypothetical protein